MSQEAESCVLAVWSTQTGLAGIETGTFAQTGYFRIVAGSTRLASAAKL